MNSILWFVLGLMLTTFVLGMVLGVKTHKVWLKLFNK
jgi:uncharacterized membrane protein